MSSLTSNILAEQQLGEFKKISSNADADEELPAPPHSRTLTDKKGFVIFGILMLVFLPHLIYTLAKSDIRRLAHGVDSCGNLCGVTNAKISGIYCSGQDYSNQSYEQFLISENKQIRVCTSECPFTRIQKGKECIDEDGNIRNNRIYTAVSLVLDGMETCRSNWWKFLLSMAITIALTFSTLVALRYIPGAVVWSIIVFSIAVLIVGTIVLWYLYSVLNNSDDIREVQYTISEDSIRVLFVTAIVWTVITLNLIIVLIVLFKKISLVVQLYKETAKVLAALPLMVFIPVLITLLQIVVLIAFVTTTVWMLTGRELYKEGENTYRYEMNGVMVFTVIFNFVITCWTLRFFAGIQHMVISGSVAAWYFAKNKQYLDSPICTSFCNAMNFHLGTVAFGSFILTLFAVFKAILRACFRNACCRCVTTVYCSTVEVILKFLSNNSFIETAIHGQSYLRSAKRVTKLLISNAASVTAINCVGDFVLMMIGFIVTVVATGISFALFMNAEKGTWILPVVICLIVNIIIISLTFSVFQIIIDTLFICFCEDLVINDGTSRPYCMSRGLMEFVENSKKLNGNENRQQETENYDSKM